MTSFVLTRGDFVCCTFRQFFLMESLPIIILGSSVTVMIGVILTPYVVLIIRRFKNLGGSNVSFPALSEVIRSVAPKLDSLLGVIFSGFFYVYFIVVKTALGIFDCISTTGGESVLESNPNVVCSTKAQPYGKVYPFGIAGMVVYGIGIPLIFGFVFFKYRAAIRADQVREVEAV